MFAFKDKLATGVQAIQRRLGTKKLPGQSVPNVDLDFDDTLTLEVGGRRLELISVPCGETTNSLVVCLPEAANLSVREHLQADLRAHPQPRHHARRPVSRRPDGDRVGGAGARLAPELLVTGHFEPITGADRIHAELTRLRNAIQHVHDQTVAEMNAGKEVRTLMREITLPAEYEVGEGYGKISCDVRAI